MRTLAAVEIDNFAQVDAAMNSAEGETTAGEGQEEVSA